jgi:hypothetical protein
MVNLYFSSVLHSRNTNLGFGFPKDDPILSEEKRSKKILTIMWTRTRPLVEAPCLWANI